MSQPLNTNTASSNVVSSLDTYTITATNAGPHVARITLSELPPTGLSVVIQQNGSTVATSNTATSIQAVIDLSTTINCAVNDVISFVITSPNASDALPQVFKGIINVHRGSAN